MFQKRENDTTKIERKKVLANEILNDLLNCLLSNLLLARCIFYLKPFAARGGKDQNQFRSISFRKKILPSLFYDRALENRK